MDRRSIRRHSAPGNVDVALVQFVADERRFLELTRRRDEKGSFAARRFQNRCWRLDKLGNANECGPCQLVWGLPVAILLPALGVLWHGRPPHTPYWQPQR